MPQATQARAGRHGTASMVRGWRAVRRGSVLVGSNAKQAREIANLTSFMAAAPLAALPQLPLRSAAHKTNQGKTVSCDSGVGSCAWAKTADDRGRATRPRHASPRPPTPGAHAQTHPRARARTRRKKQKDRTKQNEPTAQNTKRRPTHTHCLRGGQSCVCPRGDDEVAQAATAATTARLMFSALHRMSLR